MSVELFIVATKEATAPLKTAARSHMFRQDYSVYSAHCLAFRHRLVEEEAAEEEEAGGREGRDRTCGSFWGVGTGGGRGRAGKEDAQGRAVPSVSFVVMHISRPKEWWKLSYKLP